MTAARVEATLPKLPRAAREWRVSEPDGDPAALAEQLGVSLLLARMLLRRGKGEEAEARSWLGGGLRDLPDPMGITDMEPAVARLLLAIDSKQRICVHGDYDVDGCTSTAVLVDFLQRSGADVTWYAPHRERDGYGIQTATMRRLAEHGVQVVVTCDNGTSAHEAIEVGNSLGVDTLVCDHHTLPAELPEATAILNPKREGEGNPYEELAAVGVAFMLIVALRAALRARGAYAEGAEPDLREYLDIVALGTVADLAPLRGVNRILTAAGLKVMARRARPGLAALLAVSGVSAEEPLRASHLGFKLGPRINAAGRLDEAAKAVRLLLAPRYDEALKEARDLDAFNKRRQQIERETFADALRQASALPGLAERRGVVLWSEDWHPGVVGIVASRIAQHLHKPALVLAVRDRKAVGSGRGISGVDLYAVLHRGAHLFERFGGHRAAAGMTLEPDKLPELREFFAQAGFEGHSREAWQPVLKIDGELPLGEIDWALFEELSRLRPFGIGNPEPVLLARGLRPLGVRALKSDGLRLRLVDPTGAGLDAVGFGLGVDPDEIRKGKVDAVFSLQENVWQGRSRLELRLKALRPAAGGPSPG